MEKETKREFRKNQGWDIPIGIADHIHDVGLNQVTLAILFFFLAIFYKMLFKVIKFI